jgi:hypothetical protein
MGNLSNTNSYQVLDKTVAVNDRSIRQAVSETVLLLNMGT